MSVRERLRKYTCSKVEFRKGWKMSGNGLYRTLNTDFKNGELENGDCREMDFHFSE